MTIGSEYAPPADDDLASDHERILQVDQVHVHEGFCAVSRQDLRDPLIRPVLVPAVTFVSVELCSTPCKVLRFAPTPLARGLRTLTASARSSRPWPLRAGRDLRGGLVRTSRETDT